MTNMQIVSPEIQRLILNDPVVATAWQFAKREKWAYERFLEMACIALSEAKEVSLNQAVKASQNQPLTISADVRW